MLRRDDAPELEGFNGAPIIPIPNMSLKGIEVEIELFPDLSVHSESSGFFFFGRVSKSKIIVIY